MTGQYLFYILEGDQAIPVEDVAAWAKQFGALDCRQIELTLTDDLRISTMFLGINGNISGKGPPLLFETIVYQLDEDSSDLEWQRYSTIDEARKGHATMVEKWATK